ncbi:MAG TPA: phosphoribosyltransferase [Sulfolobales archaeon]|nr:phosphoribosyltransferase [Sulfolobales archaeon]
MPTKLVSWEEIVDWSRGLANIIKKSGWRPDVIVAVARGGYVPARLLCDFLGVENLLSIQSQHWTEAAKAEERAILRFPYVVDMRDKRILIVDDIVDTGDTLMTAEKFIRENWYPLDVKKAALQWISSVAKIKPDYYYIEVKEWVWFQYPWTRLEDVTSFIKRMISEEAKNGRIAWTFNDIVSGFREWYGIDVDKIYYEDALENLVEMGFLDRKDNLYIIKL